MEWTSRAVRVAMSEADWARFEALAAVWAATEPPRPRPGPTARPSPASCDDAEQAAPGPLDWMDWERQKTLKLLRYAV